MANHIKDLLFYKGNRSLVSSVFPSWIVYVKQEKQNISLENSDSKPPNNFLYKTLFQE